MLSKILATLLHFDQHDGFPEVVGEGRAAAIPAGFADAEFRVPAHNETDGLAKGLEQAVE